MGLLHQRYQQAADMLGSDILSVRLGGVYALTHLANEHSREFELLVMRLLCAFVRNPIDPESVRVTEGWGDLPLRIPLRQDFDDALQAVLKKTNFAASVDAAREYCLDLREADLSHAFMFKADLGGADMSGANLRCADLTDAILTDAKLVQTEFGGSVLLRARLLASDMSGADLSEANLCSANLSGTRLICANLSGAKLLGADVSGAILHGADVSGALLGMRSASLVVEGSVSTNAVIGLTQAQLDSAKADPENPPQLAWGCADPETGRPLEWRGASLPAEPRDP